MIVELAMMTVAVLLYVRTTRAKDRVGRWAFVGLVAFLVVIYLANLLGPPPPSEKMIAGGGVAMWLLVAWGYWIDRHREVA
jgi:hypothetical protein